MRKYSPGGSRGGSVIGDARLYTLLVPGLPEKLRREDIERLRTMTPAERVAEALALGRAAADAYAHAHGLDLTEARLRLERAGQAGRRPSRVMQEILESASSSESSPSRKRLRDEP